MEISDFAQNMGDLVNDKINSLMSYFTDEMLNGTLEEEDILEEVFEDMRDYYRDNIDEVTP
jgi:hypothetical protein